LEFDKLKDQGVLALSSRFRKCKSLSGILFNIVVISTDRVKSRGYRMADSHSLQHLAFVHEILSITRGGHPVTCI
jgi:5-carboxymethyl-2-hydroxymuconate isomerase